MPVFIKLPYPFIWGKFERANSHGEKTSAHFHVNLFVATPTNIHTRTCCWRASIFPWITFMHHLAEHQLHYSIACVAYLSFALVVLDEQISPVFSNEPLPTVSVQPLPTSKKISKNTSLRNSLIRPNRDCLTKFAMAAVWSSAQLRQRWLVLC